MSSKTHVSIELVSDSMILSINGPEHQVTVEPLIEHSHGNFKMGIWKNLNPVPGYDFIYHDSAAFLAGVGCGWLYKLDGCDIPVPDAELFKTLHVYQELLTKLIFARAIRTGIKDVFALPVEPKDDDNE